MKKKEDMVNANLGLVHACAKRFKGRGIEYDDLYQSGCLALIKAIDGFDESKGFKFSTYAVPVILGEIKRLFRDSGTVKVGRSLKELSLKVNKICDEFREIHLRVPNIGEISDILGIEKEKVAEALAAGKPPMSLTYEDDDNKKFQIDIISDAFDDKISDIIALRQILDKLDQKDKNIIKLRFFKEYTQTQTAKVLGMTQVQVSRKEKNILKKMKISFQE